MKRNLTIIKTTDTKKEYTFEAGVYNNNPQIWKVSINIDSVDCDALENKYKDEHLTGGRVVEIYVERKTLVEAKMLPIVHNDKPATIKETPEKLILRLLGCEHYQ